MNVALVYILISVLASAAGQLMLKKGMSSLGPLTLAPNELGSIVVRLTTNPYVIIGLGIYGVATLFWLTALSRVQLSFAYPFVSLNFLVILIASWRLFDESFTFPRLVGTLVIAVGVLLIARS